MKLSGLLLCLLPLAAASSFVTTDAHACGGCFVQQSETTQVSGHKMILSISNDQTTLWDQITYTGEPSSFSWVLPIKGTVKIGLSSDAMFSTLDQSTSVTVSSPSLNCLPPDCAFGPPNADSGSTGGGGVTVLAEEVVGPYSTVQLQSSDPTALNDWLAMNGYNLPADVVPVVNAYVTEGFNFLALKLVPGQGINSMRPVRVTSVGAQPVLPLRMVAAGTGLTTPITLWVMGEGRYEPANFQSFMIDESELVWDWDAQKSNYAAVKQQKFDASNGMSWLVEAGEQFSRYWFENSLRWSAEFDTTNSGYVGTADMTPLDECNADLEALFGSIPDSTLWVSRIHAQLSRPALSKDLTLQAAADQSYVNRFLQVTNTTGTAPECPPPPDWCTSASTSSSSSSSSNSGGFNDPGVDYGSGGGCAIAADSTVPATAFGIAGATFVLSLARKRSRRRDRRSI